MKRLTVEIKNETEILMLLERELSDVSFGSLDRGNVDDVTNWSCFSNNGTVEFFDASNNFVSIISSNPNAEVCIYYCSNGIKKLLATFLIDEFEFSDEQKKVSLKLKDRLIDWQRQNINEYYEFYPKSLYDIWAKTFSEETEVKNSAENLMRNTTVEISYMEKGNKWSNMDKICQASMTRCFCDADGKPVIADETPRHTDAFVIRPSNILSIENKITNRKTKVEDVTISAYNYTRRLNEPITNELPFTWYNVIGKDYENVSKKTILAEWANYFVNVSGIGRINGRLGAYVDARIPKSKDHIFNVTKALARTNVVAFEGQLSSTSRTLQSTDIDLVAESPGIGGNTPSFAHDRGDSIDVYYRETQAIESYNADEPTRVGDFCTEGGSLIGRGDFFTEDGSQSFGSDSEYATQLASNELIQVLSTFGDNPLAQHIIDTVNEKYSNGVECVVMEVTPSEYFGVSAIIDPASNNPLFERYDIVIPYVIRNGVEQPYSKRDNGTPKSFKIVGIEYSYRGLLRQKLHLQENID